MKKKIFIRGFIGILSGISLGYIITVLISVCFADGNYYPCVPEFVSATGNEMTAVILQTVLCGILGFGCAAGSVIWEIESWGLVRQTGVYFLLISVLMLPIAYITHWMKHSVWGFLIYFGIFSLIFCIIWILQYIIGRQNVKILNKNLNKKKIGR